MEDGCELMYLANPFIKSKNRAWEILDIKTGDQNSGRGITSSHHQHKQENKYAQDSPSTRQESPEISLSGQHVEITSAAVEAGQAEVRDHLQYFSTDLERHMRQQPDVPHLSVPEFVDLYKTHQHAGGHHFVIHQHDHPVAGVHYDLRLQISATSSISFACMYGLPGNPNSKRLNRNATETRVHNLWNHLIETASHNTGSLLIWDIGAYEILPRGSKYAPTIDPDSASEHDSGSEFSSPGKSEPEKLAAAFANRKIKLRLHGTKLPKNYTLSLRLTKSENRTEQPKKPVRKRRRLHSKKQVVIETSSSSDSNEERDTADTVPSQPQQFDGKATALEREIQEQEDETVRQTNAYPGAANTIGSIHQRKWYLSIDRNASGFVKTRKRGRVHWQRGRDENDILTGFESFYVLGRDYERSVVTRRSASEIMDDEHVVDYVGRKGWRPVME